MARFRLRRRDRVNHGNVSCPSGRCYVVDQDACIEVDSVEDRDALLEVGRPPRITRETTGRDNPGFWELVCVDGMVLMPDAVPQAQQPEQPKPQTLADPAAIKTFGSSYPAVAAEIVVEADEPQEADEEADEPVVAEDDIDDEPVIAEAVPANWREAKRQQNIKQACQGVTAAGNPCRRAAVKGEVYCSLHLKKD